MIALFTKVSGEPGPADERTFGSKAGKWVTTVGTDENDPHNQSEKGFEWASLQGFCRCLRSFRPVPSVQWPLTLSGL